MKPYYTAWKSSKHSHVPCVDCHYPPGTPQTIMWKKFQGLSQIAKYVTRTYSSKPFAEVDDISCLRSGCHSTRLLKGRVISEKGIKFDHSEHIMQERKGRQIKCVTCHSQIVVGKHVEVTYDSCYLCHFKGRGNGRSLDPIGSCLGCHEVPKKSFKLGYMTYNHKSFVTERGVSCEDCHLEVIQGDGEASQDRCFTCHNEPEKLEKYGEIKFLHENHVTKHNVACFHCHQEIRHGFANKKGESNLADLESLTGKKTTVKLEPSKAHPPRLAFECVYCHQDKHSGQMAMYSGKVAELELPEMPSPMYMAHVDCVGCHYQDSNGPEDDGEFTGKTFLASDDACVKCHGPEFEGIWEETKFELEKTMSKLTKKIEIFIRQ